MDSSEGPTSFGPSDVSSEEVEADDISSPRARSASDDALTHRPRKQQKQSKEGRDDARNGGGAPGGASVTEIHTRRRQSSLAHPPKQPDGIDLRPLAEELVQIAQRLRGVGVGEVEESVSRASEATPVPAPLRLKEAPTSLDERRKVYAKMARATYAKRRKRTSIFDDPDLFGEPGWDILLDLYIAQVEGKPVSVSSACIGSASPPTTGLRWLGVLAEQNLVLREHDPEDQRRVLVRLTEKAMEAMDAYFASSASSQGDLRAARA